jgi:hypothetical protein
MIRRRPPRPRGQHQDFHFFAAGDPIADVESQFASLQPPPAQIPDAAGPAPAPSGTVSLSPAASSAIRESIEFLAKIDDPTELIGQPRPAFMTELDALAATRRNPAGREPAPKSAPATPRKRQRTRKRRTRSSSRQFSAGRHERRCSICSHPDRAEIEADFIEWSAPADIAREYGVTRNAIYRHARGAGLFASRDRNLRFALGRLIESADAVQPTADSIVRAVHAFARINDQGQWVEPPAHVIVSSGGVRRESAAPPSRRPIAVQLDSPALAGVIDVAPESQTQPALIGTPERLENDATH